MEIPMPTFMCFLNWTDQGAKKAKDANKRFQASKSMAEKLRGKLLSAYVTTGHYDVVLTLEMPNGEGMIKLPGGGSGSGLAGAKEGRAPKPGEVRKAGGGGAEIEGTRGNGGAHGAPGPAVVESTCRGLAQRAAPGRGRPAPECAVMPIRSADIAAVRPGADRGSAPGPLIRSTRR